MLSAIVLVADTVSPEALSPEAIVRTLSSLVPCVVEGLVRDLTLATSSDIPLLREIADHAGCDIAVANTPAGLLAAGLASARGDWILAIRAGYAPRSDFSEEIADVLDSGQRRPHLARLRAEPDSLITRLAPSFATWQSSTPIVPSGRSAITCNTGSAAVDSLTRTSR